MFHVCVIKCPRKPGIEEGRSPSIPASNVVGLLHRRRSTLWEYINDTTRNNGMVGHSRLEVRVPAAGEAWPPQKNQHLRTCQRQRGGPLPAAASPNPSRRLLYTYSPPTRMLSGNLPSPLKACPGHLAPDKGR